MFGGLRDRFGRFFSKLENVLAGTITGEIRLTEDLLDEVLFELQLQLLEADVAQEVVDEISENLKQELLNRKIPKDSLRSEVKNALRKVLLGILDIPRPDILEITRRNKEAGDLSIFMFVGVNGTGKTTTIAKIANLLKKNGYKPVVAAADTFRAAAIEQLDIHCRNLGIKLIKHDYGSDPAAVVYDAINHARARGLDSVLIDTAGRMHTDRNLMDELRKIKRVGSPDLTIFVGDALTGNDAINQAREFDNMVGIDCVILTKIDADAKGGAAISIARATGKPVIFLGNGQGYDDLIPFDPRYLVNRILGDDP